MVRRRPAGHELQHLSTNANASVVAANLTVGVTTGRIAVGRNFILQVAVGQIIVHDKSMLVGTPPMEDGKSYRIEYGSFGKAIARVTPLE